MTDSESLHQAVALLKDDAVIITVTDTIPGLSCLADSHAALDQIIAIKQRPTEKGLILTAGDLGLLEKYCQDLSQPQRQRLLNTDQPTTWLVAARASVDQRIRGTHATLAIRVSNHPTIMALTNALQRPLVTTSANSHGQQTPTTLEDIPSAIRHKAAMVLGGPTGTGTASEIRRLDNNQLIRT